MRGPALGTALALVLAGCAADQQPTRAFDGTYRGTSTIANPVCGTGGQQFTIVVASDRVTVDIGGGRSVRGVVDANGHITSLHFVDGTRLLPAESPSQGRIQGDRITIDFSQRLAGGNRCTYRYDATRVTPSA